MPDLLLELFSEEIPARMQRQAAEDLKRLVTNALVERNLLYEGAQSFVTLAPEAGALYMWESWLRHEVLPSRTKTPRVSISFNYAWK